MKKFLLLLVVSSFSVMAATPKEVIAKIELEKNAKCDKVSESIGIRLNNVRYSKIKYRCVNGAGEFQVKLKVAQTIIGSERSERRVVKTTIKE